MATPDGWSGTRSPGRGPSVRRAPAPPASISVPPRPTKSSSARSWAGLSEPESNWSRTTAFRPLRRIASAGNAWPVANCVTAASSWLRDRRSASSRWSTRGTSLTTATAPPAPALVGTLAVARTAPRSSRSSAR
ncbi:MAG: hypothetical protein E6J41_21650 [Chloroflexi bacterium]|nr:MAG: hypothetical protein E6J41_21650 [Chloroflexota bacterium]